MRLAVVGANGRMGQEILLAVKGKKEVKQLIGVVRQGVATGYHRTAVGLSQQLANESDLLIDFSLAKSFDKVLLFCKKNKLPLVSGVTGLSERQQKKDKACSKSNSNTVVTEYELRRCYLKKGPSFFAIDARLRRTNH